MSRKQLFPTAAPFDSPDCDQEFEATVPLCPPEQRSDHEPDAVSVSDHWEVQAEKFDKIAFPAILTAILRPQMSNQVPPEVFPAYVNKILRDAGSPQDPVERALVEQITLARHHAALLAARSANTAAAKEAAMLATASTRIHAEMRRMALALKEYRQAAGGRRQQFDREKHPGPSRAAVG
jgi:hypothetical protein